MCRGLGARLCKERSRVPKDVPCFFCCLPLLHGCCTLSYTLFTLMGRVLASPGLRTMAPLFHRPGSQLKETPIREASISGVRLRGHAQVRLLFTSVKPTKTLQPRTWAPPRPPLSRSKRRFCQSQKSATNWTDTFGLFIPLWRKAPHRVIK